VKQRILIVDQDPDYREILTNLLEKKGYMVTALDYGYRRLWMYR
jgi:DNA-binding response OmpR family regulator